MYMQAFDNVVIKKGRVGFHVSLNSSTISKAFEKPVSKSTYLADFKNLEFNF